MSEGDDATNVLLSLERQGLRILVSGNDETAGGVGSIGSDGFRLVDRIPTSGLASNGAAVVRGIMDSLYDGAQETTVIVTDDRGLKRLERLDDIGEIHDIAFDGDSLIVVSTGNDTIARIESTSFAASTSTILHTSGKRTDQHHLNCLAIHDGQLFATAFESRKGRRWRKKTVGEPRSGVLFNVTTGENVMANLDMPHSPRRWRDSWVLAESGAGRVVVAPDSSESWEIPCKGWTRGMAIHGDILFVGISARRDRDHQAPPNRQAASAHIEIHSLADHQHLGTLEVPFFEIYDLLIVSESLAVGLERGAASNALRVLERAALDRLVVRIPENFTMKHLEDRDCVAIIDANVPVELDAGSILELQASITNAGTVPIFSIGDQPVRFGWYFDEPHSGLEGRTGFPQIIYPGETVSLISPIEVPEDPGPHRLHLGVLQERHQWFDGLVVTDVTVKASN